MRAKNLLNRNHVVILLTLLSSFIIAQTIVTKGKVTDSNNEGIPEVTISVKNGTQETTSDLDGNFQIETETNAVLIIDALGFKNQEIRASENFQNISLSGENEGLIDDVVLVGTRSKGRTQIDTPVPVDILDIEELTSVAPQVTVSQILNYAAPSFSSTIQSAADGTDHIDPATLRGLGPDQVLVLINGKRRHNTALVNINGTVGRGSTGTDMNAIPSHAIKRIEILRDGAAAQYGSDAIAGVINIVLKTDTNELDVIMDTGAHFTKNHGEDRDVDGETFNLGLNYGLPIGNEGGFINFTGQFESRGWTDRNGDFSGSIFNAYNAIENVAYQNGANLGTLGSDLSLIQQYAQGVSHFSSDLQSNIANATSIEELQGILGADVTDAELAARGQNRSDYNLRFGQSKTRGGKFFFNSVIPVSDNAEVYGFGGLSYRNGEASAFYRLPNQSRTYTPLYVDGYLPLITSDIKDQSLALGIRGKIGDWDADFSNTWGKNTFDYTIKNTSNASLENISPNELEAGGYGFLQNTTNFDLSRKFDVLAGFNLALGAEYRFEEYEQKAGQEASYAQYDSNGDVVLNSTPTDLYVTDFFGNQRAGGAQGFGGIAPNNAGTSNRNAIGIYADGELDLTDQFLISGALRFEEYSDFGSTLNFKVASRYKFNENMAVRGAISSGFRAPSLHQINFTSTATNFDTNTSEIFEVGTFANTSAIAKAFGIPELEEEKSMSYSAGFTGKIPSLNLKITLDGYYIQIDDRIIMTENISRPGDSTDEEVIALQRLFDQAGVDRVRFFSNTADTESMGLDLVLEQRAKLGTNLHLTNTLSGTLSKTNVTHVNIPSTLTLEADNFFSNRSELILEESTPRTKGNLSQLLTYKDWSFFLRNSYFGEVKELSTRTDFVREDGSIIDDTYGAKLVTDLSIGYTFKDTATLTLGANNIFDIYPEEADPEFTTTDRFPYSRNTQFGYGGRYLFARLNIKLN